MPVRRQAHSSPSETLPSCRSRSLPTYVDPGRSASHGCESFSAEFHGRIRSGPDEAWMSFTGKQLNTFGPRPRRVFLMDATRSGLPVTVLHSFKDTTATMRAKVLVAGPRRRTPPGPRWTGARPSPCSTTSLYSHRRIVDAPVRWTAVDAEHVRGVFTDGDQSVTAELTFDAEHDLVNFSPTTDREPPPTASRSTRCVVDTPVGSSRRGRSPGDDDGRGALARARTGGPVHLRRVPHRRHRLQPGRPSRRPVGSPAPAGFAVTDAVHAPTATRRALTCTGCRWVPAKPDSACGAVDECTRRSWRPGITAKAGPVPLRTHRAA